MTRPAPRHDGYAQAQRSPAPSLSFALRAVVLLWLCVLGGAYAVLVVPMDSAIAQLFPHWVLSARQFLMPAFWAPLAL